MREHLKRDDLTAQERAYFQRMLLRLPPHLDMIYRGVRPSGPTGLPTTEIVPISTPAESTLH